MAITNPFSITYGTREVGGATDYQLYGPYVIEKNYDVLRLVFDVVVVGSSYATLKSLSDALEADFRKRLTDTQTLIISLDTSAWTYTMGTTLLKAKASITKSGNPDSDKGFSRMYTCSIEAELPADDANDAGLRDVEVLVDFEAGRQKIVTMRGIYTATSVGNAVARYIVDFDAEATVYLDVIDNTAIWELVDESYTYDRERDGSNDPNPHNCIFARQYVELLASQSQSYSDDPMIRDHRVVFTDLSQHPGDAKESLYRLRRVIGAYDCAIDIGVVTNLQLVFNRKVLPHVRELFRTNFQPKIFCIEDRRVSYDETSKRMSVSIQFLYQSEKGEALVEVSQSVAYRENRTLDYTPMHDKGELTAEVDVGWATLERIWNRTAIAVGDEAPKLRITEKPKRSGDIGLFTDSIAGISGPDITDGSKIQKEGWNTISNTSQVEDKWIGDPDREQIKVVVLTETVVQRYHTKPGAHIAPVSPVTKGGG